ncbi:phosphoglycerate mutase family protein [Streptomyces sp. NBC_01280]|uniref:histidine phosphatase family protein n=1 Tax=Streptomyces sp. NBC_01280 TaxID=2903810 RepID=UPI002E350FD2|nr:histidine phosphatase family protein [Streptomyces sp. NBC_01280]
MTTTLIRHARTPYSARYLVNGDPSLPIALDKDGVHACHEARTTLPPATRTWVVSAFLRTQQTARLLSADTSLQPAVLPQLNELDYGDFEGGPFLQYADWLRWNGPHTRPPKSAESQHEGIRRMLLGVRAALKFPGPRTVVAHGLLLSVLGWDLTRTAEAPIPLFFPEAPCLAPLTYSDSYLDERAQALLATLAYAAHDSVPASPGTNKTRAETPPGLATVGGLSVSSEEQSPHA